MVIMIMIWWNGVGVVAEIKMVLMAPFSTFPFEYSDELRIQRPNASFLPTGICNVLQGFGRD
jgi:hypothetical protein